MLIKFLIIDAIMMYIVACSDINGDTHTPGQRVARALFWPITLTSWFINQPAKLHRLLNILWILLISGWFVSLIWDRLPT